MSTETDVDMGRSPERIVEAGAGGVYHRALALFELDQALYVAEEEFRYDDDPVAQDLTERVQALRAHLFGLSVTNQATLTLDRECETCGGDGKHWDHTGTPCEDCNGMGFTHAGSPASPSLRVSPPANSPQTPGPSKEASDA